MIHRQPLLQRMRRLLRTDYVALIGQHLSGVRTVVRELMDHPGPGMSFLPAHLPSGVPDGSELKELFLERLLTAAIQVPPPGLVQDRVRAAMQQHSGRTVDFRLRHCLDVLGRETSAQQLVVVLYALEGVPIAPLRTLLLLLRDYHSQRDTAGVPGCRLRFLVAGYDGTWRLCAHQTENLSPFNIATPVFVEGLSANELDGMEGHPGPDVLDQILMLTGGVPWMVRSLCVQGASPGDVRTLYGRIQQQWSTLSADARAALREMAVQDGAGISCEPDYRCPQIPIASAVVEGAFWRGFLSVRDSSLIFRSPAHRQFVQEQRNHLETSKPGSALVKKGKTLTMPNPTTPSLASIPTHLKEQISSHRIIPFVGAGVSMAVRLKGNKKQSAFPSWKNMLVHAADRLEQQKRKEASLVRSFLDLSPPKYLEAAQYARDGLGALWPDFVQKELDPLKNTIMDGSLGLARAVWNLGSKVIITTNYDRVLDWACPAEHAGNLQRWGVEASAGLARLLRNGLDRHTVWHLHGNLEQVTEMILTPDGYQRLYPSNNTVRSHHEASLRTLESILVSYSLLFIGFSMDDEYLVEQIRLVDDVFKGCSGQHYVLVRQRDLNTMAAKMARLPVQPIPFDNFGVPQLTLMRQLASLVP